MSGERLDGFAGLTVQAAGNGYHQRCTRTPMSKAVIIGARFIPCRVRFESGCKSTKHASRGTVHWLVRSRQVSPASAIVSPLWKVDDTSNSEQLPELNGDVRAGRPYHEYVCLMMFKVNSNSDTQEPYSWAPFFLVEDHTNWLFARRTEQ